jgi:predicted ATPase
MRIRRFSIQNFRQFQQEVHVDLQPITVLIGLNNSGKSTILQALNVFQYCLETCRTRNGNSGKGGWTLKARNISPEEFGRLPFSTPSDLWPQGRTQATSIRLTAQFDAGGELSFEITLQYNLFNIKPVAGSGTDLGAIARHAGIRLIPIFSGLLPREELLIEPARLDRERAQRHGDIVRNLLLVLKKEHKKRYQLLRSRVADLYPDAHFDVEFDEELGLRSASAKIDSSYGDTVLKKERDVIVAGSGFHQTVQILAGVLQPGASIILLDEPDAHLHARLQHKLMEVLRVLSETENLQFILATHSPQLLRAAPPGSLLVCQKTAVAPFPAGPEALSLLDNLGALERMDLVPLLQNRRVIFVEDRDDRRLIELFTRKELGDQKADAVLRAWTFLYTYQEPVAAGVRDKARQVRDLLADQGLAPLGIGPPVAFLAVGDRDYRSETEMRRAVRGHKRDGIELFLWPRNEIENYLLDARALKAALRAETPSAGRAGDYQGLAQSLEALLEQAVQDLRTAAEDRMASHMQQSDRRMDYQTVAGQSRAFFEQNWGNGIAWSDAKKVLAQLRLWAQKNALRGQVFSEANIIAHMSATPDDVRKLVVRLRKAVVRGKARRKRGNNP